MYFRPILPQAASLCAALALLPTLPSAAQQDPKEYGVEGTYLKAYMLVQEAEKFEKQANRTEAYFKYLDSSEIFDSVARDYPDWNASMVAYRRNLVRRKMDETRVYTDPYFRAVLRALEEKKRLSLAPPTPTASETGVSEATLEVGSILDVSFSDITFTTVDGELGETLSYGDSPIGMLATDAFGSPKHRILIENRVEDPVFSTRMPPSITVILTGGVEEYVFRTADEHWVPIVGDIPCLGRLFWTESEQWAGRDPNAFAKDRPLDPDAAQAKGPHRQPEPAVSSATASGTPARATGPDSIASPPAPPNTSTADPNAPPSAPILPECIALAFLPEAGGVLLTWTCPPGQPPLIEGSNDLATWVGLGPAAESSPGVFQVTDPAAASSQSRFYRAVVL